MLCVLKFDVVSSLLPSVCPDIETIPNSMYFILYIGLYITYLNTLLLISNLQPLGLTFYPPCLAVYHLAGQYLARYNLFRDSTAISGTVLLF